MALDPSLKANYEVKTPPLGRDIAKFQGMLISEANRDYRFCAFEPFSPLADPLECGVFVTGSTDTTVIHKTTIQKPAAAGANILGVTLLNFQKELIWNPTSSVFAYPPDTIVSLLEKGDIVMYAEVPVSPGDPVFFRHTANGGLTRLGAVANAAGTGLEKFAGRAFFLDKTTTPGLVRVNLKSL